MSAPGTLLAETAVTETPAQARVRETKARVALLRARTASLRAELAAAEHETRIAEEDLEAEVSAAVAGEVDPTEWLPDELIVTILFWVVHVDAHVGACAAVCRRWHALCQTTEVYTQVQGARWRRFVELKAKSRKWGDHDEAVMALAIGQDGLVYSAGWDSTIKIWAPTGIALTTLNHHNDSVFSLAVSPAGVVCAGSYDGFLKAWSESDGVKWTNQCEVTCIVMTHAGTVFTGSDEPVVRVWSEASGDIIKALPLGNGAIDSLNLLITGGSESAEAAKVYGGSASGYIAVWTAEGDLLHGFKAGDSVVSLAVDTDGTLYSGIGATIKVWEGITFSLQRTLKGHSMDVIALAAHRGALYSSGEDWEIRMWQSQGRVFVGTVAVNKRVHCLALDSAGRLIAGFEDGIIRSW